VRNYINCVRPALIRRLLSFGDFSRAVCKSKIFTWDKLCKLMSDSNSASCKIVEVNFKLFRSDMNYQFFCLHLNTVYSKFVFPLAKYKTCYHVCMIMQVHFRLSRPDKIYKFTQVLALEIIIIRQPMFHITKTIYSAYV
jgi:hypothetical protein